MKIEKNDPRLTLYALNELEASEIEIIENELKINPELKDELKKINTALSLLNTLNSQEKFQLSTVQRNKIYSLIYPKPSFSIFSKLAVSLVTLSLLVFIFTKNTIKPAAKFGSAQDFSSPEEPISNKSTSHSKFKTFNNSTYRKTESSTDDIAKNEALAEKADNSKETPTHAPNLALNSAKPLGYENLTIASSPPNHFVPGGANDGSESFASGTTAGAGGASMGGQSANADSSSASTLHIHIETFGNNDSSVKNIEFVKNKITPFLNKCLQNNLSIYIKYNLNIIIAWQVVSHSPKILSIYETTNSEVFSYELKLCIEKSITAINWSDPTLPQTETHYGFKLNYKN